MRLQSSDSFIRASKSFRDRRERERVADRVSLGQKSDIYRAVFRFLIQYIVDQPRLKTKNESFVKKVKNHSTQ